LLDLHGSVGFGWRVREGRKVQTGRMAWGQASEVRHRLRR
jgi:hypothetical protein